MDHLRADRRIEDSDINRRRRVKDRRRLESEAKVKAWLREGDWVRLPVIDRESRDKRLPDK